MTGDWIAYLTPDEVACCQETDDWLQAEASRFKKALAFTRKPIEYAYSKVPESLRDAIASAILSVLNSVKDGSASLVSQDEVHQRIGVPGGGLGIFQTDVRLLDAVAQDYLRQSKHLCTAEGAATGLAGLPGIVVDIPALYGLLFRMIAQISVCYGYSADKEDERNHILKVLDIGHLTEPEAKRQGMTELDLLQQMIRDELPVLEVQRFAVEKGLQTMARHLGLALTQRKLAQSVALVGGVVGAGVNRQLAGDVGDVAFHAYRRRHLIELAYFRRIGAVGHPTARRVSVAPAPAPSPSPSCPDEPPVVPANVEVEGANTSLEDELDVPGGEAPAPEPALPETVQPSGGAAKLAIASEIINLYLSKFPDYQPEYRHGCLLAQAKLPISTVRVLVILSCSSSHIIATLPFSEIKAEGAPAFLVSKIVGTFWGTFAKQVENIALPKLKDRGFPADILTLERGKNAKGEFGQLKVSIAALNRWLAQQHPRLQLAIDHVVFSSEHIELQGRVDTQPAPDS